FDVKGELWSHEMGPRGGDELNLIKRGGNYGYPIVSDGDHYSGKDIPDHSTRPEFNAPLIAWTPVISPGGLVFYTGDKFKAWRGNALIAGLSSRALIRVSFDGNNAREVERFPMGQRIREVEQGPNGNLWLLENGPGGRLLKLTEKN
ncbi:MAG: PQQ-dependent sugar dehydrogenase, partial [Burkholderiaceae bacterium]